ncbi:flagellar hook-basal body complex protein FliE [Desulfovibrio legallii]|uniref:Flagellar hook-basal body complex protein FliE n=1 Tax=Desulfovibrio legallii TaxID=571438 RepID=A0A1G7JU62_9BACT|nr:flagellar hook-basal body complex protein FliE [Desulfovibrio legallii]SDF28466.1 flagellar hook-basal body complex protein FliE [Desulfovibrio legallii]
MSIQTVGMRAYSDALRHFTQVQSSLQQGAPASGETLFAKTLDQSLLRDSVDKGETFGAQADFMAYPTQAHTPATQASSFTDTATQSLNRVNELQQAKDQAIVDFASGRNQNVHELMIAMQKSSLAMKLTTAVRGKVLEAYKELSKMQF